VPVLVRPPDVTENTGQRLRVGLLNPLQRAVQLRTGLLGCLDDVRPVAADRDDERVVSASISSDSASPKSANSLGVFVVPAIADPLEEHDREDVRLEIAGVDRSAERVGGGPES
jgi:hypothetical protein